ncbi:hypothetical protein, partial [Mitsuaria sp. TWR114]|uniref:hypothetical protein n=1 Tax=Mitsuaria sp. TWR114 TaxID=2601731 RepID=UPI001C9B57B2
SSRPAASAQALRPAEIPKEEEVFVMVFRTAENARSALTSKCRYLFFLRADAALQASGGILVTGCWHPGN